jgi:hypothetical protein
MKFDLIDSITLWTVAFKSGDGFEGKGGGTFGITVGYGAAQGRVLLNLS